MVLFEGDVRGVCVCIFANLAISPLRQGGCPDLKTFPFSAGFSSVELQSGFMSGWLGLWNPFDNIFLITVAHFEAPELSCPK